jgi:hypothetical protein
MKNEHLVRWQTNNLKDFYSSKLKNVPDNVIEKLYKELYCSNKKNGNNYNTIGSINFTQDNKYEISIMSEVDRKMLEPNFKEFKFEEVGKYCYIMYSCYNKESLIVRLQYPWLDFNIKLPINYIFKNYNPQEIYKNIQNKDLELIIKLIYGRLRDSILQQSMLPNSKSIINIIFPDGIHNKEDILIQNIYEPIIFTEHTGIHIPDFEEKLDICLVFQYITTSENSYYQPIVIPKYKCLKSIKNRRKLFENFKIKECDRYYELQNLYNEHQTTDINNFTIPNSTFYITTNFNLYYDKGTIIYDYKFRDNIILKIKSKQRSYTNFDKKKFGNVVSTLTIDEICKLLWIYNYKCDQCGINICINYNKLCPNQFSIDRIDDNNGHTFDNCRVTCLDCNRLHKKNELFTNNCSDSGNFVCKNIEYKNNKCSCINSIENICDHPNRYEDYDY